MNRRKRISSADITTAKRYLEDKFLDWDDYCIHNIVTEYVLEALDGERGTADTDDDFDVSAEEVYEYAGPLATQYCIDNGLVPYQHAQLYDNYPPDSPSSDDLAVIAPIPGDFDLGGDVDYDDLNFFVYHWQFI